MSYYKPNPPRGGYPAYTDTLGRLYGARVPVTEHGIQTALCDWLAEHHPNCLYYAVPNAGKRGPQARIKAIAEGLKAGVPDLCICEPRGGWHGLYVELKTETGKPTAEQILWLQKLGLRHYKAVVCRGYIEAVDTIDDYLQDYQGQVV